MSYEAQRAAAFRDLLERLTRESGIPTITAAEVPARAAGVPTLALLFTGEATRSPESWDVCVVLPELLRCCPGLSACVLDPAQSRLAATAYGVDKLPALVTLRAGAYTGVIEGMRDWDVFVHDLRRLMVAPPQPPPVSGVYPSSSATARSA